MTLDPEAEALLREEMRRTGDSFKTVLNRCVVAALRSTGDGTGPVIDERPLPMGPPFPWARDRLPTRVAEDLEISEYLERMARDRRRFRPDPQP